MKKIAIAAVAAFVLWKLFKSSDPSAGITAQTGI